MEPFTVAAGTFEWTVAGATKAVTEPITTSTLLAEIMDDPQAYEAVMAALNESRAGGNA